MIKPSDTRLAHKQCVKAVKASYAALVVSLDSNYQNFHEPETLGLYKVLSQFNTIASSYLLDYTLPHVSKLAKHSKSDNLICPGSLLLLMQLSSHLVMPLFQLQSGFWNFWILRMTFSKRQKRKWVHHFLST